MVKTWVFILALLLAGATGMSDAPYVNASLEEGSEEEQSFNPDEGYDGEQPVLEEDVPFGEEEPFQSEYQTPDEYEVPGGEYEEDLLYIEEQETAERLTE